MSGVGLDEDGFIRREGDLARVPAAFAPVVEAAKIAIGDAFGPDVLHSAYLYGSPPRGTAVPGVSDLDIGDFVPLLAAMLLDRVGLEPGTWITVPLNRNHQNHAMPAH